MTARRTPRAAVAVALLAVALLAACGGERGETEAPGPEARPATGDMLVVGIGSDADVLFPPTANSLTSSDVYDQIFWYLMRSQPNFIDFDPGLADSFRFSDDSLAVDFFIHPGVRWHDGHPFTAADVVFAHEVCAAPEINWSAASWLDHITDVEAVDSLTVRFHYDEKYMYQVLDANVCYPLPEHLLGDMTFEEMKTSAFTRRPVGTGPFRFVSWTPGEEIVIEANPDFFRGRPYLNRVSYRVIPEPTSLATQIQNGNIDLWPRFQPSFYPQLSRDPDLEIASYPGRSYTYIAYNTQDSIFADRRVRQALTMAIDRERLVEALLYGQGRVGTQPMITTIWAHDPSIEPWPHDPDRARRLLDEAGWTDADGDGVREKDGRKLSFAIKTNSDNTMRVDIATIVQDQWRQVGADARLRALEFNTFIGQLLEKDFQTAISGWSVGIKAELEATFGSGQMFNFVGVENARLDSLIERAGLERDREAARRIWGEAQRIIVDEAYYTFLFQLNELNAIDDRFEGVNMTPYGWGHYLEEWYVPEGRQRYEVPVGASPFADRTETSAAPADSE